MTEVGDYYIVFLWRSWVFLRHHDVPVGHIWKFDVEKHEIRNFGRKFNFSKFRMGPVMLNFLAKTENLRNRRSERPMYNRGKVL